MNKQCLPILIIFILVPLAYSAEQDWLISKASQNNWNNNIQDTSLALSALKDVSYTNKQETIVWLENKMNSCVTSDSCNIKDASLALLALNELSASSEKTVNLKNWLLNASTFQYSGETAGWKAQIISTAAGSCTISDPNNPSQSQLVTINAGFTPWVDIGSLISQTTNSIKIDCTSLSSTPISLSLIREASSTRYYINKEITNQKEIILELGYPCWGTTFQANTCDKESTAFALFALEPAADPKWLEKQDSLTPLQNALLYSVTNNNKYLTKVLDEQNRFGYWGSANLFETAFITIIIPDSDKKTKALSWISSQKATTKDCWPKPESLCNVKSTATALLNQLPSSAENTTEATTSNQTEERKKQNEEKGGTVDCPEDSSCTTSDACPGTCDYWGLCQDVEGDNCPEGDTAEKQETCKEGSVCTVGACPGKCDAFGDCVDNADDNCTPETTTAGTTTPQTTGGGSSVLFWFLMVLLLLIVIAGGGYLAYKKGLLKFNKKPSKPSSAQTFRHPFAPASQIPQRRPTITHPVKGRIQHDLDRSITEMEKFLKGRKK